MDHTTCAEHKGRDSCSIRITLKIKIRIVYDLKGQLKDYGGPMQLESGSTDWCCYHYVKSCYPGMYSKVTELQDWINRKGVKVSQSMNFP